MSKRKVKNQPHTQADGPASKPAIIVRPPEETLKRLRRAIGDRSVERIEPHTAQGIIVEALETWLKKHAY